MDAVGPLSPVIPWMTAGLLGISLGVNPINALVLGTLGIPGFGLLLMLQWLLQV